jgi:hypothetical protein
MAAMKVREVVRVLRGAVREAREAVRRGDRDRALDLLRRLDETLSAAEREVAERMAPAFEALSHGVGVLDALERVVIGRVRR